MREERHLKKYEFICMDEKCIETGQPPCVISLYGEDEPDYPSYCPWEIDPKDHKFVPWKRIKN